ncbi:MAG: histidine phosphatase family protein [Alphaproteobacteria bacterium]|jgi:broad specificity phosphatase PhoE|nr:histidine phosphatase family protein [Alphaproteobacteria bacterium]MBT7943769.1 histidine phosphatase family protein [Alphaproteobacteria bacterium]
MLKNEPFYFLRHGQTDWNAEKIVQGQTDVPLNATGLRQAKEAKAILSGISIPTICASPLDRALRTATIVNEALNSKIVVIDELQECFFGEAEGQPVVANTYGDLIRSAVNFGGESFEVFVDRVISGVNKALGYPGPVLIVAHGGAFKAVQSHIQMDHDGDMPNCIPVRLQPFGDKGLDWAMETLQGRGNG